MFHARGFHGVSLADVASRVGMTPPAIYRHFRNKQDLLLGSITYALDGVESALDRARHASLDALILCLADAAVGHRELWVLLQRDLKFADTDARASVEVRFRGIVATLGERIGQERPDLGAADRHLVVTAVLAALATPSLYRRPATKVHRRDLASIAAAVAHTPLPDRGPSYSTPSRTVSTTREEQVLVRAIELFAARGYSAVSIDDIGAEVGIAGPSIYHHFATKAALLTEAFRRAAAHLSTDRVRAENDPQRRLDALLQGYVRLALDHRDLFAVYIDEAVNLPRADARQIAATVTADIDLWASTLREVRTDLTASAARLRVTAARGVVNDVVRFRRLTIRPLITDEIRALSAAALGADCADDRTSASPRPGRPAPRHETPAP
ncbi:hypothetical protein AD006_31845 (plasmid) [Pseudonocardia sp. EC080610-09]|nr:hypothetical protein AD006_31845 [Pseudonocardia sp. EC080610-09]ALL85163.1 hypothetical protein AD017_28370 [Pseudonocardia sp. EC080619-01]